MPSRPAQNIHTQTAIFPWWLLYVCFVIYGSLVPLEYQPIPWDQAWLQFKNIQLLNIGAQGRADWVANGVLYIPVGFLTVSMLLRAGKWKVLALIGALLFGFALALAVEFTQIAFPARTVSLNDVFAEFVGGMPHRA